ncbi:MAG: ABC transporter permease [Bacillota bacterium]|nr:ABC transporter permease [Bacillota bacterium]
MEIQRIKKYVVSNLFISITLFFFFTTVLSCISRTDCSNKNGFIKRMEINLTNKKALNENYICLRNLENIKRKITGYEMSYISELDTFVEANNRSFPVNACLTDNSFSLFSDINIVKGSFFNESTSENGFNAALISEDLAEKLYGSYDIIGNKIELFNEKYKITGIYRNNKSIISFLSSDGVDRIYIPFKSYSAFKDLPVKTVFFSSEELENTAFRDNYIRNMFGIDNNLYKINDYYSNQDIVDLLNNLFIFIIGIWIIIVGIRLASYFKSVYAYTKRSLEKVYLKEMINNEKGILLKSVLIVFGSISFILVIVNLIKFKVNIPTDYIPLDNILDFNFYFERLRMHISDSNLSAGYIPTRLETFYSNVSKLKLISFTLCMVSFLFTISFLKIIQIVNLEKRQLLIVFIMPVIIAVMLSLSFSYLFSITFSFPFKEVIIIYFFIFTKTNFLKGFKTNLCI